MAAIYSTVAQVVALAPALADVDQGQLLLIVGGNDTTIADGISRLIVDASIWGDNLSYAHLLLAAHLGSLILDPSYSSFGTGAVTSRTVDKVSESYSAGNVSVEEWQSTPWGLLYLLLLRSLRPHRAQAYGTEPPDFSLPGGRIL